MSNILAPVRFEITNEAGAVVIEGVMPRICFEEQAQAGANIREIPAPLAPVANPSSPIPPRPQD